MVRFEQLENLKLQEKITKLVANGRTASKIQYPQAMKALQAVQTLNDVHASLKMEKTSHAKLTLEQSSSELEGK